MVLIAESGKELSLVDQGYKTLRMRIVRAEYLPGSRLKLDALQQSLRLSSSPLREALNRLVAEGLVDADEGRGFRAAPISIPELMELTDLRLLLEADALRGSVSRGDGDWECRVVAAAHRLRRSEDPIDAGNGAAPDPEDWSDRHRNFHVALLSGCGNPRLLRMCEAFFDQAERYRRIARLSGKPRNKDLEHRKLEEAALSRDADRAVEILTLHIRKTAARVVDALRDSPELTPKESGES
jgi:GntR family carbon starvation induced transcriptional regulator